jgi:hypothetical protein
VSDESVPNSGRRGELIVEAAFARIDIVALATASGVIGACVLFFATAWLLLRGAPAGVQVGAHLGLLAHYLPGYSVSWGGAVLGVLWGFAIAFCLGAVVGAFWNLIHYAYLLALSGGGLEDRTDL